MSTFYGRELMEKDVSLSPESFRKHVDGCLTCINRGLKYMLRLFLVEDLVDSLKVGLLAFRTYAPSFVAFCLVFCRQLLFILNTAVCESTDSSSQFR